ncbi:MAG TPA: hypothetical protein VMF89_30490, partial [Polyangiales bacterium]|nr:hypothetical protein [Polyangiales bacterium]
MVTRWLVVLVSMALGFSVACSEDSRTPAATGSESTDFAASGGGAGAGGSTSTAGTSAGSGGTAARSEPRASAAAGAKAPARAGGGAGGAQSTTTGATSAAGRGGTSASSAGSAGSAGTVAADGCTRALLQSQIDAYFTALAAHDPSSLPLADNVKFTENGEQQELGKEGLWSTAGAVQHVHSALDTEA